MDDLLAGTLFSFMHGVSMPGNCPAWLRPSAARLWKTSRSKPKHHSGRRQKVFAFPPETVFAFITECCSDSQRNGVRLHNGIAFAFDRIPQKRLHCETFNEFEGL